MKTVTLVSLAAFVAINLNAAPAISVRVVERASDHERIETVYAGTNGTAFVTNHYTRIGNGINYQDDNGNWVPSIPLVQNVSGGIVCTGASYQVILNANLNTAGAVDLLTCDKNEIVSRPLGIRLHDPDSGSDVFIAQIKDCQPLMTSSNEITYLDAFEGNGIRAAVVYRYDVGRFSQDVKFLEQPSVTPADFGMGSRTRLEILTEIEKSPVPTRTRFVLERETNLVLRASMTDPDFVDEKLVFGKMVMGLGRAFEQDQVSPEQPPPRGIAVGKHLEQIGGRTILVEAVPWQAASAQWSQLPRLSAQFKAVHRAAMNLKLPATRKARRNSQPFATRLARISHSRPILTANATYVARPRFALAEKAFAVDYTIIDGGDDGVTFNSGETYLVEGQVTVYGQLTVNPGAIVKYGLFAGLNVQGQIFGLYFSGPQTVFTSMNDNSVGETIDGSSGYPGYSAAYAIVWESYGTGNSILGPSDFRYCYGAINITDTSGYTWDFINTSFENSSECVVNSSSADAASMGTVSVCNVNSVAMGNVTMSSLSNCNPNADTNGNGIPDWWEVKYFHNLNQSATGDYDGDGLENIEEYLFGTNPTVKDLPGGSPGLIHIHTPLQ